MNHGWIWAIANQSSDKALFWEPWQWSHQGWCWGYMCLWKGRFFWDIYIYSLYFLPEFSWQHLPLLIFSVTMFIWAKPSLCHLHHQTQCTGTRKKCNEKKTARQKNNQKRQNYNPKKDNKEKVTIRQKVCTTYIITHNAQGKYI